ncbi:MAG: autotransporter outer membrane beta-barrel domain-containing protein [Pseudomonadota bacterium]
MGPVSLRGLSLSSISSRVALGSAAVGIAVVGPVDSAIAAETCSPANAPADAEPIGLYAFVDNPGGLILGATFPVYGTQVGMLAKNYGGGSITVFANETVGSPEGVGVLAINGGGTTSLKITTVDVCAFESGVVGLNNGTGDLTITTSGDVSGGNGSGIDARNYNGGAVEITSTSPVHSTDANAVYAFNDVNGTDTTIQITDASSGGGNGIQVDHRGTGALSITVSGTVSGVIGINNVDTYARGATIELTQGATVETTGQKAIVDGDGATVLESRGDILGPVFLNGGDDRVDLVDGSAPVLIDLGDDDDQVRIFGANGGGGWDDADFSGGFDNNGDQPLNIVGGDGDDQLALFAVTALGDALGAGTGFEQISLQNNTLIELNSADLSRFGTVIVDSSSTLQSIGNSPSDSGVGTLINAGTVDLQDGAVNDSLTINGNYVGVPGSKIMLDFDASTGTADQFVIAGQVGEADIGDTTVDHEVTTVHIEIHESDGDGGRVGDQELQSLLADIELIEVAGDTANGDFELAGPVEFGIFDHELVFEDGTYRLRPDFFDQIYIYENLPGAMQTIGLALTGQLVERVGVRSAVTSPLTDSTRNPVPGGAPVDSAVWGRAVGVSLDSEGDLNSSTGTSFEQTIGFLQAGIDFTMLERDSGRLLVGALGHWGTSSLHVLDSDGGEAGEVGFDFYGGGLTATWYSTAGWYFDNILQYTAYDIDISGGERFHTSATDGYGISLSHELGYRIPISQTAALVPQAQIVYQHTDFDDFMDGDGIEIRRDDGDSLVGRLGVAFENSAAIGSALATGYIEGNVLHEFLGDNAVDLATDLGAVAIRQDLGGTSAELGFGGTVAVNRGVSLFAEVDYTIPFDDGVQGFQALGGIRINLNPAPPPPPPPPAVVVEQPSSAFIVFFDWDRADLTPEANLVLDDVVVVANQFGYASVRLDGYTDLSGSAQYNLGLSERRANSVANGLIARGIAPDEIVIRAFGEENPLVPTPDGVREPQNRRVEIFLS